MGSDIKASNAILLLVCIVRSSVLQQMRFLVLKTRITGVMRRRPVHDFKYGCNGKGNVRFEKSLFFLFQRGFLKAFFQSQKGDKKRTSFFLFV